MGHVVQVPGRAQSREARHTVQRAWVDGHGSVTMVSQAGRAGATEDAEPLGQAIAPDGRVPLKHKHRL